MTTKDHEKKLKKQKVYMKEHLTQENYTLAVCDENTLGKKFTKGKLSITVTPLFYQGELVSIEKAIDVLKEAPNSNLVGNNIVKAAVKANIIQKDAVLKIGKTTHAQKMLL
ncbi:MAG: DUF424 domain-containing protein [Candidatus Ranarchaeia archaeon]